MPARPLPFGGGRMFITWSIMKKNGLHLLLFLGVTGLSVLFLMGAHRLTRPHVSPAAAISRQFIQDLDSLENRVNDQLLPLARRSQHVDSLQRVFLACRLDYKKLEAFTEYFFPTTSRYVNGPPLPEIEVEENKQFEPGGFQVMEEYLFPALDTTQRTELVREVLKLQRELKRYRSLWEATTLTDAHIFDALRLQVFRMVSLGISGFDTPLCKTALPEAAESLASLATVLENYESDTPAFADLLRRVEAARTYLLRHPDFDAFDRMKFIRDHANPLTQSLLTYQKSLNIEPFTELRPLKASAATLFDVDAFNPDYYAPTASGYRQTDRVLLGKKLFFDPVLSSGGQRSCAHCHQPDKAFTDGLPKNITLTGQGRVARNTPTLLNAALQAAQFYDMRAPSLENQSLDVVHNVSEMQGSLTEAARRLQADPQYVSLFKKAFPEQEGVIEPTQIQSALAAFERSLVRLDSRFDRYVRGERGALTAEEIHGFNLFTGKAKCGICHFTPLFNGTVPPAFLKSESEVIGVPIRPNARQIDPDLGRYAHVKLEPLKFAFKTPTVRNVAHTAPYMHNGAFRTLEEVVEFYDRGGGNGLGFNLDNQTLPEDKLNLTQAEKKALAAFMKAL